TGYPEKSLSVTTTIFVVVKKINPRKAFRQAIAPRREREGKDVENIRKGSEIERFEAEDSERPVLVSDLKTAQNIANISVGVSDGSL
ncbi:hypothetical protein ACLBYN_50255, partial [Pseudomonas aeruginosa]